MQPRQQIKEQIGVLEEQIELLGAVASINEQSSLADSPAMIFGSELILEDALATLRGLFNIAQEQQNQKAVSAPDFLAKIIGILVQDAAAAGFDVAITHFGEGRISMEMAELVLGAIISGLRASLRGYKGVSRTDRLEKLLFPTFAFYLEVRANPEEIQFRLVDDGPGYGARLDEELASEKQFQKLRLHIARSGGWFSRTSLSPLGGLIEFKVPLPRSRFETLLLRSGAVEALLPTSCVVEVVEGGERGQVPAGAIVARLSETSGLERAGSPGSVMIRVGVADFQFWITCDAILAKPRTRRVPGDDLVSDDSWFRFFGLIHESGRPRVLPLFEGDALMRVYAPLGGKT